MAKGVKKIKWIEEDGKIYPNLSKPEKYVTIYPNQWVYFTVDKWESGTTADDKEKELTWMMQTMDKNIILSQKRSTKYYKIKIPKKLCGTYFYYIEASLSGESDSRDVGVHVRGYSPALIVSSKWSRSNGGESIKNKFKAQPIVYGDIVYLSLQTEGLNGEEVTVELYNSEATIMGKPTFTYPKVLVTNGEVNLMIENTHFWRNRPANALMAQESKHEFCVKIKRPKTGKYIKDNGGGDLHATYLNVENGVSPIMPRLNTHQNLTPTTVDKPDTNLEKYEPCKFTEIKISETQEKDGKKQVKTTTVFKDGQKLENVKNPDEKIRKAILFEFDSTGINLDERKELDNILSFLLSNEHSNLTLEGYACVIGREEHNQKLSERRANSVKEFFVNGKLDPRRITAVGRGEVNPTDDKAGRDNIRFRDEREYKEARTVYISFAYQGHDADTLVYSTIAPSIDTKKPLTFDITEFQTVKCFRAGDKHEKKITLKDIGQIVDKGDTEKTFDTPSFVYEVYSDLSRLNTFPLQYIWPSATTPNKVYLYLHSCRYYSNKKKATVLINVYPDIKWDFHFFLNLSNKLSVKWQNLSPAKHREMQSLAGKIGAEKRWKQTEIDWGVVLEANWDKYGKEYKSHQEFTFKFEDKIKAFYSVFGSLKEFAKGVTGETKGVIRENNFTSKLPLKIEVKPPNFCLGAEWQLERAKKDKTTTSEIGTTLEFYFKAEPLIGVEITIDLLDTVVQAGVGVVSGGSANVIANTILNDIRNWLEKGDKSVNLKMYIDLKLQGTINGESKLKFNTNSDNANAHAKLSTTIGVELDAGIEVKAKFVVIVAEAYVEGKLKANGKASATFGHKLIYEQESSTAKALYYTPELKFNGLVATIVLKASVGLMIKKGWFKGDQKADLVDFDRKYEIIKEFDLIKKLEEYAGVSAKIPLIKK